MRFHVEKNWAQKYICGEKMTNMRSGPDIYQVWRCFFYPHDPKYQVWRRFGSQSSSRGERVRMPLGLWSGWKKWRRDEETAIKATIMWPGVHKAKCVGSNSTPKNPHGPQKVKNHFPRNLCDCPVWNYRNLKIQYPGLPTQVYNQDWNQTNPNNDVAEYSWTTKD